MNNDFQIADDFILPLFDEIFVVKERDFSIEYNPLGKGLQKLLMLVSNSSGEYAENHDMQLLETIITKGLRKHPDDVWIVNIERFPKPDLNSLWEYFQPQQAIVWGCNDWLKKQEIKADLHKQIYVKGSEFLLAAPLSSYLSDNQLKSRLWGSLQRMFFN